MDIKSTGLAVLLGICSCFRASVLAAADTDWSFSGHFKAQFLYIDYPENSLFREILGSSAVDNIVESRLKLRARNGQWDFRADYQFIATVSDTLRISEGLPDAALGANKVISDDRRWWNLTHSTGNDEDTAVINRLDRLSVGHTGDKTSWRFGRQAISWGNGLIFTPMDVFNPFDPAAVDKEYKTGDDMLYGQYLLDNGNDLQGVAIVRRDPRTGNVQSNQSSLAFKFHGFLGMNEYDLLAAQHYGDQVLGVGAITSLGGAIWRGDLTWTHTERDQVISASTSLSYSWTWAGKNISGLLEYYYNGFGQKDSNYSTIALLENPDLLKRLDRGELYTIARQYLAASATVELSPLFNLVPTFFINLEDPSALAQIVFQYDWKQNLQILGALNFPIGPDGSEYGGIETPTPGLYLSTGPSLFAQLAWYF